MDVKGLLIGILLGGSLLTAGVALDRTLYGVIGLVLEAAASAVSSAAAFCLFPVCLLMLLLIPESGAPVCRVTALAGPLSGAGYTLKQGQTIHFGRENCEVLFPPDTRGVGRRHCRMSVRDGAAWLEDENSSYGTFLLPEGRRLLPGQPERMADNSLFCLASTDVVFRVNYFGS